MMPFVKKNAWPLFSLYAFVLLHLVSLPSIAASWSLPVLSAAEVRVALVVGVDEYDGDPLRLPVRDAELISRHLEQVGFDVMLVKNPTKGVLVEAIDQFVQKIRISGSNVTALFFFAGHAVQFDGHNYMIPVNAGLLTGANRSGKALPGKAAFVDRAVDAQLGILNYLNESGAKQVIFVLDACRTNPFSPGRRGLGGARGPELDDGLAPMDAHPGGADTFILFAAAPTQAAFDGDKSAQNSPFSQAFARAITQPGSSLEMVFREVNNQVRAATGGLQRPYQEGTLFRFSFTEALRTPQVRPRKTGMLNTGFTDRDYDSVDDGADLLRQLLKTRSIEQVKQAAESGDAEAQYLLACAYLRGVEVEVDIELYAFWVRRSATQGFSRAQFASGQRLFHGWGGITPNKKEGIEWWNLAIENGNATAMLALGNAYLEGTAVVQDLEKAESLFNQALAIGSGSSYSYLGNLYGVRARAAKNSGDMAGYKELRNQQVDYYLTGAGNGCSWCNASMAYMYRNGIYVSKDLGKAKLWYIKAIDSNDRNSKTAAEYLAYMLSSESEMGTPQYEEAVTYWRKAIELGSGNAKYELAYLVYKKKITSVTPAEALAILEELADGDVFASETAMANVLLHSSYYHGNHLVEQGYKKAEEYGSKFLELSKKVPHTSSAAWPMRATVISWNLIDIYKNKGITPSDPNLLARLEFEHGTGEKYKIISLPFICGDGEIKKQVYIWDWSRPESPIKDQLAWQDLIGCKIAEDVEAKLNTFYTRARTNAESFLDLAWEEFGTGN